MKASLLFGPTSIQSFPSRTTGHDFLHSWLHFLGLHLELLTMAIRVKWSSSPPFPAALPAFFFGGIVSQKVQSSSLFEKPSTAARLLSAVLNTKCKPKRQAPNANVCWGLPLCGRGAPRRRRESWGVSGVFHQHPVPLYFRRCEGLREK